MLRRSLILWPLVLLAACGKPSEEKQTGAGNVSAEAPDVAEQPAATEQMKIKAGQWTATTELVSMDIQGVDPALLKGNIGQKTEIRNCVTPEQASRPAAEFFANPDVKSGRCKSEKFEMAGGRMSAVVVCQPGDGQAGPMRMEMTGTYAPDAYETTVTMTGQGGPNGADMKMVAKSSGRLIADRCDG